MTEMRIMNCLLTENIDRLHTTEMGIGRIRRNLALDTDNVVGYCKSRILAEDAVIEKQGKNWYIRSGGCVITVNAGSYTIITAHKEASEPIKYPTKLM